MLGLNCRVPPVKIININVAPGCFHFSLFSLIIFPPTNSNSFLKHFSVIRFLNVFDVAVIKVFFTLNHIHFILNSRINMYIYFSLLSSRWCLTRRHQCGRIPNSYYPVWPRDRQKSHFAGTRMAFS